MEDEISRIFTELNNIFNKANYSCPPEINLTGEGGKSNLALNTK